MSPWNSDDVYDCPRGCGMRTRSGVLSRHEKKCVRPWTIERLIEIGNVVADDPDECWEWQGTGSAGKSYGTTAQGRSHRVALAITLGRDIKPGYEACHHCDNPKCLNPRHLFEGTHRDNHRDMAAKGRWKNQYSDGGGS